MPDISPASIQELAQQGHKRLANFRASRLLFLRNYCGPYYDQTVGNIGNEAINLIYSAVRSIVPAIVMTFPRVTVESRFLASKDYADLLALALNYHNKISGIETVYRRAMVDALFTLGTLKTGLAASDTLHAFDDEDKVDTGEVFTEVVSFDNLIVDPNCKEHLFSDARFIGDKVCIARETLLASGLYDNALIEKLPRAGEASKKDAAADLSKKSVKDVNEYDVEDSVEIAELWFPQAGAVVTVPASCDVTYDKFLRVHDYYGPKSGPYTFLGISPPTPDNPIPVPPIGVWNDLHVLANRMAKKIIDQATRQKDVTVYKRSAADDAMELRDATDGEGIAVDDPDGVKVLSWGGQKSSNEQHLGSLANWFNMMAANPEGISGQRLNSRSATEARILAGNAQTGIEDMRDAIYRAAKEEHSKRAWFFHTDPFIKLPLIRQVDIPAQVVQTPAGPVMASPPQRINQQIILTPEMRSGEWLDFNLEIEPESMGRMSSERKLAQAADFAVKILPAAMQAAQTMAMLQLPFNAKEFIIRMANISGITWMDQVLFDPEFQQRMAMMAAMGPQNAGKAQPAPNAGLGGGLAAILQNGQPGQVQAGMPTPDVAANQQAQLGANPAQAALKGAASSMVY